MAGGNGLAKSMELILPCLFGRQNMESPALYTLVCMDPDAPSREVQTAGPWRHSIMNGLRPASLQDIQVHAASSASSEPLLVQTTTTEALSAWVGPSPGVATGQHRYLFFLYRETIPIVPMVEQLSVRLPSLFIRGGISSL